MIRHLAVVTVTGHVMDLTWASMLDSCARVHDQSRLAVEVLSRVRRGTWACSITVVKLPLCNLTANKQIAGVSWHWLAA